jgi:hypothetical protein
MFKNSANILRKKKILGLLTAAIIIIGTLIVAFHYHDDGKVHADCPICRLQVYGIDALATQKICAIISHVFISCYFILLVSITINNIFLNKNAYPNAPPVIS